MAPLSLPAMPPTAQVSLVPKPAALMRTRDTQRSSLALASPTMPPMCLAVVETSSRRISPSTVRFLMVVLPEV